MRELDVHGLTMKDCDSPLQGERITNGTERENGNIEGILNRAPITAILVSSASVGEHMYIVNKFPIQGNYSLSLHGISQKGRFTLVEATFSTPDRPMFTRGTAHIEKIYLDDGTEIIPAKHAMA